MTISKLTSYLHRVPALALAAVFALLSASSAFAETAASKAATPPDMVTSIWPLVLGGVAAVALIIWIWIYWYLRYKPLSTKTEERLSASDKCFVANLSVKQIGILHARGCTFRAGQEQGLDGIIFDKSELDKVIEALEGKLVAALPTTQDGLAYVILRVAEENFEPDNYDNRNTAIVQRTAGIFNFKQRRYDNFIFDSVEPLMSAILVEGLKKRHIWLVHKDQGYALEQYQPSNGTNFSVTLPLKSSDTSRKEAPPTVFGFQSNPLARFFAPTNKAVPLADPTTGFVLAEVYAGDLKLHFNPFVDQTEEELAVFARLLQGAVAELNPSRFVESVLRSLSVPEQSLQYRADGRTAGPAVFDDNLAARHSYIATALLRAIMVPALGRDIYIKDCNGHVQAPLKDGMFHIFLHSATRMGDTVATSNKMFSIPRAKGSRTYLPTGSGLPLVSDEGDIYGEYVDDNLYIFLSDALGTGTRADAEFFARMMIANLGIIKEVTDCQVPERNTQVQGAKLARYGTDLLKGRSAKALGQLTERAKGLPQAQELFGNALRQLIAEQKDLTRLNGYPEAALGAEFDAILTIKKVLDVEVTKSRIIVKTDTLYCVDPRSGKKHEIGKFEIFIRTSHDDDEQPVRWMNRTRTVTTPAQSTMHAPHVSGHGAACMGNTKGTFPMLVEKREFASVVELAIAFVESVNVTDTWGKHIDCWPEADD